MKSAGLVAYIDVDDTLVRSFGAKRMPIVSMVDHVRLLHSSGVSVFLWSSAGAEYARATATELGVSDCITAYLPKPHIIIDDQALSDWRRLVVLHPNEAASKTLSDYNSHIFQEPSTR